MKEIFIFFLIMICFCVYGCKKKDYTTIEQWDKTSVAVKPVNVGSGLYYFDNTSASLGKSLEPFVKEHPELELVSMAPLVGGFDQSITYGYYVFFRLNEQR